MLTDIFSAVHGGREDFCQTQCKSTLAELAATLRRRLGDAARRMGGARDADAQMMTSRLRRASKDGFGLPPGKESRPYTSQFRLSGTERNLHPDDQFTLREPTTRQVGPERTRYGMGVRGLGSRPADPDDMSPGPTGGGAGTRPRPSPAAGRYGGQWAEAQLVGLRQRGRPAKEYIREFQKLAGRLRSWPDRLMVHHFRNGLDNEIRRACIVRGIGGRLSDWFKAAMELDIGLREHTGGRENKPPSRRGQDPLIGHMVQATPDATRSKTTFRCFRCNRPGHRAAECGLPAVLGTPTAIGKPGSTPQKMMEKSRIAHQAGQTPIQPASDDHSPMLQKYEDDDPIEDSMCKSTLAELAATLRRRLGDAARRMGGARDADAQMMTSRLRVWWRGLFNTSGWEVSQG
ncbi:Retrotransposon-derived protein PEG10 [Crotalus adamanteus]|uniref:Retrotransposon-derived protein PEG10 n=1 Tax=Crotalus adamanteus TaxID=8729 RepID=A0AAW1B986_CROAD